MIALKLRPQNSQTGIKILDSGQILEVIIGPVRDQFRTGGGGDEASCSNIFSSACPKFK